MVNYDDIVEREYFDIVTGKRIKVNLPLLDALYIYTLEKLERAVRGLMDK